MTPLIWDTELFKISGHYDNYSDNMFFSEVDEREYGVKPMNCPGHTQIFAMERRSYRDLPIRYADFARLHRYERSGVTHGLVRVRSFAQDDAHLFVTPDQIEPEIDRELRLIKEIYDIFGFKDVRIALSTRPEKRIGTDETWDNAERGLENALKKNGVDYHINPGDGAFYGPKLEFQVTDAIGRPWQLGTIQLDYALPERFKLSYIGADNAEHQPVMIHRAILGSLERFIGIIIEALCRRVPVLARAGAGDRCCRCRRSSSTTAANDREDSRGRAAGRGRRIEREARREDPRRAAQEDPVHAGRRREGSIGRNGVCAKADGRRSGVDVDRRFRRRGQAAHRSPLVDFVVFYS